MGIRVNMLGLPFIIRPAKSDDISALAKVVDDTDLFPSTMLPDMMRGALLNPDGGEIWLICEIKGEIVGFCYATLEKLTTGTWNMLAIGVHSSLQAKGVGTALVTHLEALLRKRSERILIAETAGIEAFEPARQFYLKNGFLLEATIRDFWSQGNDKLVFLKKLS